VKGLAGHHSIRYATLDSTGAMREAQHHEGQQHRRASDRDGETAHLFPSLLDAVAQARGEG
jgi:hypothetical protein